MRAREPVVGNPLVEVCSHTLLARRAAMKTALADLHRAVRCLTQNDTLCRRCMTSTGVGPGAALAFKATINDPIRFRRSNDVDAHLGLTPSQHQPGARGFRSRIARSGGTIRRMARFTTTHGVLTRSREWTAIRAWGARIARRSNLKTAKIAMAGKLAAIRHRMWREKTPFRWAASA